MEAKFIVVLIVIGIEHLLPQLDQYRSFAWWDAWRARLSRRFGRNAAWDGPLGVGVCLFGPLAALAGLLWLTPDGVDFLIGVAVLLYSLGPRDLGREVERYSSALVVHDEAVANAVGAALAGAPPGAASPDAAAVTRAVLVRVNDRTFAVLAWFAIAGPLAAFAVRLLNFPPDVGAGPAFRRAAASALALLLWLPGRLLALGYALTGSMVHAVAAWRFSESLGLAHTERVLERAGLGALQVDDPEAYCAADSANRNLLIGELRGLIARTLFAWLTLYAVLTIVSLTG